MASCWRNLVFGLAWASAAGAFLLQPKLRTSSCSLRGVIFQSSSSSSSSVVRRRELHRAQASSSSGRETSTRPLVLGLNKYSHDAAACIVDANTGAVLFAGEKERLTRKKHDAGAVGDLVAHALEAVGASLEDVCLVVQNNHHHRIAPFEARLPFAVAMQHYPEEYLDVDNLLPRVRKLELSHHLAHAWAALGTSPWSPLGRLGSQEEDAESTLVVVMDGMGETLRAMQLGAGDSSYQTDLTAATSSSAADHTPSDSREAESAYLFDPTATTLSGLTPTGMQPVWKRFTEERSPSALENHGFENMESMGAMYSRVSSAIFGDWNACGKVMGLAPWAPVWQPHLKAKKGSAEEPPRSLLVGSALEGTLAVDWDAVAELEASAPLAGWKTASSSDAAAFAATAAKARAKGKKLSAAGVAAFGGGGGAETAAYASMAASAQSSLEAHALPLLLALQKRTTATRLCVAGGVAQNSVLNGRVVRECGFARVHIPHCVGDEGIAVGCALYGAHLLAKERHTERPTADATAAPLATPPAVWQEAPLVPPYLGKRYSADEVADAVAEFRPFLREVTPLDENDATSDAGSPSSPDHAALLAVATLELRAGTDEGPAASGDPAALQARAAAVVYAARALAAGELVGWHQGRAEFGPRALGARSLLADPRNATLAQLLNSQVKKREAFRPFAPAVLAEEADKWFMDLTADGSPFMGLTVPVQPSKAAEVPGVLHGGDGSARLQTVKRGLAPAAYRALIAVFFALTGVPLVLNTSFNVFPGEPVVESPRDAIRAFLGGRGPTQRIGLLVLGPDAALLRPQPCPVDLYRAHGDDACLYDDDDVSSIDDVIVPGDAGGPRPLVPTRRVLQFRSETAADADGAPGRVRVWAAGVTADAARWVDLFDALELAILEACDGTRTVAELVVGLVVNDLTREDGDSDEDGDEDEEGEVTEEEILVRLQRLWDLTLIHF